MRTKTRTFVYVVASIGIVCLLYMYYKDIYLPSRSTIMLYVTSVLAFVFYGHSFRWVIKLYIIFCVSDLLLWVYMRSTLVQIHGTLRNLENQGDYGILLPNTPYSLQTITSDFLPMLIINVILWFLLLYFYKNRLLKELSFNKVVAEIHIVPRNCTILILKIVLLFTGLLLFYSLLLYRWSSLEETTYVDLDVIVLFISIVCVAFGKTTHTDAVFFALLLTLHGVLYVIDNMRDRKIYMQLLSLPKSNEPSIEVMELFPNGLPSSYMLSEPAFYGNILLPWIPDQPPIFTAKAVSFVPFFVFYLCIYYIYGKILSQYE